MRARHLGPAQRSALLVVVIAGGCTHTISTRERIASPSTSAAAASGADRATTSIAVAHREAGAGGSLVPDPSGLEYVRATVALTDVNTATSRVFEVRGWLSPDAQQPSRRRLLTWGALWYPVIDVIGPADWRRDLSPLQLFWARSSAALRATRQRWNTFTAHPDVRHAMLRAIDERTRELAR